MQNIATDDYQLITICDEVATLTTRPENMANKFSCNSQIFKKINTSFSKVTKQILRLKAKISHCLRATRSSILQRFISHLTPTQNRSTRARRSSSKSSACTHSSKSSDGDGAPSDSWHLICIVLLRYFFTQLPLLASPSDVFANASLMGVAK